MPYDRWLFIQEVSARFLLGLLLLGPFALKFVMKKLVARAVNYFSCFWIALAMSMLITGVLTVCFPDPFGN